MCVCVCVCTYISIYIYIYGLVGLIHYSAFSAAKAM